MIFGERQFPMAPSGTTTLNQLIIACDVGNSRVKYGLFRQRDLPVEQGDPLPSCVATQVVPRGDSVDWAEFRAQVDVDSSTAKFVGIIAGTDRKGVAAAQDDWPRDWASEPTVVERPDSLPVDVRLPEPSKVGIDRLLNAIAANVLRSRHAPAIVVDSGTATTVDAVDAEGAFRGGVILPGFELSARALHRYTALLPLIEIEEIAPDGPPPLGRETRSALHSGLYWGQLGAVRELITRLSADESIAGGAPPAVYLTGGGATLLKAHLPNAEWKPYLSLQGLACAFAAFHPD